MEPEANHSVIMVIEDDPSIRTILRYLFEKNDYTVMLAESGDEALIILTRVRPDLITLDLNLPGINGDAVLKELRGHEATKSLPVVVVSAEVDISPEVQAQAQAIVRKPFTIDGLLAVVHRLLPPLPQT